MRILTSWLRRYLPTLPVADRELADALTLRGIAVEGVHDLGEGNGHLFEMDITTNRVDAMNHYGIAREAATIYGLELPPLRPDLPAAHEAPAFPVRIAPEAEAMCGRFTTRVLRGITIRPSEGEVARFFGLLGQRPIGNAVDASNFTLLGMGHPTHAFDLDTIEGGIVVRLARAGERLRLLDGTERVLEPDDLVIADERKALSLAGVMGGLDSSITAATRNVLVESAWFDPAAIRRSSRRHLLHTDASHRFERGADFQAAPLANNLVSQLILESGGGTLEGDLVDVVIAAAAERTAGRPSVVLPLGEVHRQLGTTIEDTSEGSALTAELVERYLRSLGCGITPALGDGTTRAALHGRHMQLPEAVFEVQLPSWRLDLERPIDLIEEIARVFGYNRFANTLPTPLPVVRRAGDAAERAVRGRMLAMGFTEAVSSTFAAAGESERFAPPAPGWGHVRLENPLSEQAGNLRPSLVPGMLEMLAHNLHRDVNEVRLFEQGQVFEATGTGSVEVAEVHERPELAIGTTATGARATALYPAEDAPVFELKGIIEQLTGIFAPEGGAAALQFTAEGVPAWLEPGRSGVALLHGRPFAQFGELARDEAGRRKLRQPVYLAAINLGHLLELPLRRVTAAEPSRFQAAERDFSFVFPDSMAWGTIASAIESLSLPELEDLRPVDIFRDRKGVSVPAGQHSLLLRTVFRAADHTLDEEELTAASARIVEALTALGGVQRA